MMNVEGTAYEVLIQVLKLSHEGDDRYSDEDGRLFVLTKYGFLNSVQYSNAQLMEKMAVLDKAIERYHTGDFGTQDIVGKKSRALILRIVRHKTLTAEQKLELIEQSITEQIKAQQ